MKILQNFYLLIVRILSPVILGVLIGVITGLIINILTDKEQLSQNKTSIIFFAFSVLPLLVMIHIRDDFEIRFQKKIASGGDENAAWRITVSPRLTVKNLLFGICVISTFWLVQKGIKEMTGNSKQEVKSSTSQDRDRHYNNIDEMGIFLLN